MKKVFLKDFELLLKEKIYEPREDSELLMENMKIEEGERVLDLGTGSGILSLVASKRASSVLGVDINKEAVKIARKNSKLNNIKNVSFKTSDLFENIDGEFDVMLFNPPYLPVKREDNRWSGGKNGRKFIEKFSTEFKEYLERKGRIYIVCSSLTGEDEVREIFTKKDMKVRKLVEKKVPWEKIIVFEIKRKI